MGFPGQPVWHDLLVRPGFGRALAVLREARGLDRSAVAQAAGIDSKTLTAYERGGRKPNPATLARLLAVIESSRFELEGLARYLAGEAVPYSLPSNPVSPRAPGGVTQALESLATARLRPRPHRAVHRAPQQERDEARRVWRILAPWKPLDQIAILEEIEELPSWALCELICAHSVEAARGDADRAVELAKLAVEVADRIPGEPCRARAAGYSLAFVANAKRVAGDIAAAEKAFDLADSLWRADGRERDMLEGKVLDDLRVSLLREQHRLDEALTLMTEFEATDSAIRKARIWLNKATIWSKMGDPASALALLQQASTLAESNTQLSVVLRFNLALNHFMLGRMSESDRWLREADSIARQNQYHLDRLRIQWLQGRRARRRVAREEALIVFRRLRAEFQRRRMSLDFALATIELADLLIDAGAKIEVQNLSEEMAPFLATACLPTPIQGALLDRLDTAP